MHRVFLARTARLKYGRTFSLSAIRSRAISDGDLAAITAVTEEIMGKAAMHNPPKGWNHSPRVRGEEKRLANMVKSNAHIRAPSIDKSAFLAAEVRSDLDGEDDDMGDVFTPGTFVEIRRNEVATHGVVLGQVLKDSRWHIITLTTNGEVWDPLREDVMFAVPDLVTPDLAHRCSMLEVVTENGPLQARIKVLQHIRQIERTVEDAMVGLRKRALPVYSLFKSQNPDEWGTTTTLEVARWCMTSPTLVDVFAAHKFLFSRADHFVPNHSYRLAQSWDVRPESHLQILKTVTGWSRQHDGPISDFVKRALPVMEANRQLRFATRNAAPSQRPANHTWTAEDVIILKFLHHALRPSRSVQKDPYSIGQSAIMRHLCPDTLITDNEVHMALVDLGVYAPWQDLFSLRLSLKLDQEDPATSPKVKALDDLVKRSLSTPPAPSGPLGPEDFYATDPLEHLRHDFGDMPIYVIDDAYAQELDDGFSVETVAGEPDNYWVHVHIADPASTIPPTHILARQAAKQSQTSYFAHRSWPLFPKSLMFSGQPGFSLSRRENRVLTFSSKINASGELVECVVRPGIARNFVKLAYDDVDLTLFGEYTPRLYPFSLPPPKRPALQLPETHLAALRTMDMLQKRIVSHRLRLGRLEPNSETPYIKEFAAPKNIESPTTSPSEFRGFPTFTYFVTRHCDSARGARGMVAEAMKLAGRTAARWCAERGVPTIYRTASPLEATPAALEELCALRDDLGFVDMAIVTAAATSLPMADYSLMPGAHWGLAIPEGEGYVRATSPLRRYSDLLVHYQIHRTLLGQAPHFDTAHLQEYKDWLKADDRLKSRSESLHLRSWVLIALKRWMADPRPDVPDPLADLHAVLMRPPRHNSLLGAFESEVRIPALGIAATLVDIPKDFVDNWTISSSVRVKIKEIHLGVRPSLKVAPSRG